MRKQRSQASLLLLWSCLVRHNFGLTLRAAQNCAEARCMVATSLVYAPLPEFNAALSMAICMQHMQIRPARAAVNFSHQGVFSCIKRAQARMVSSSLTCLSMAMQLRSSCMAVSYPLSACGLPLRILCFPPGFWSSNP